MEAIAAEAENCSMCSTNESKQIMRASLGLPMDELAKPSVAEDSANIAAKVYQAQENAKMENDNWARKAEAEAAQSKRRGQEDAAQRQKDGWAATEAATQEGRRKFEEEVERREDDDAAAAKAAAGAATRASEEAARKVGEAGAST